MSNQEKLCRHCRVSCETVASLNKQQEIKRMVDAISQYFRQTHSSQNTLDEALRAGCCAATFLANCLQEGRQSNPSNYVLTTPEEVIRKFPECSFVSALLASQEEE